MIAAKAENILTVCTGSFLLKVFLSFCIKYIFSQPQAAGVLQDGTKVATYWRAVEALRKQNVDVVEERVVQVRHVNNQKILNIFARLAFPGRTL